MYLPAHFAEQDVPKLHAFIRAHSFGMLISQVDAAPFATHLPFTLDASKGAYGTLYCHVARANPHWRGLATDAQALVIFRGPHVYISPSWYVEDGVPTWNYTAVHAYGQARVIETPSELTALLATLVEVNEAVNATNWAFNPASPQVSQRLGHIVGIEIPVQRLHGKFKLNQNRSQRDQRSVITRLRERDGDDDSAIATLMEQNLKGTV